MDLPIPLDAPVTKATFPVKSNINLPLSIILNTYQVKSSNRMRSSSILKSFKSLGPKNVVITDGTNGSYALDSDSNFFHQEIVASETVETTGAGDAYAAAFFAAFISNKPIQECMRWGALNSSSVIEHIGAQEGLLTLEEMEKKLNG